MRHSHFIISSLIVISFFSGCTSSQQTSSKVLYSNLDKNFIMLGSGGGFSGIYTGYVMSENGDLYSWRSMSGSPDTLDFQSHSSPDSAAYYFSYLNKIGFQSLTLNSSGNMNSFIELKSDSTKHRVQWADGGNSSVPPEISTFNLLMHNYVQRSVLKK